MGALYASSEVIRLDWLLYMCLFKFQGLNGYYICDLQSPMVWMVTLFASFGVLVIKWVFYKLPLEFMDLMVTFYASFGVPRIEWLLYLHPLKLKGGKFVKCCTKNFLCVSTYGAQTFIELCTHIWFIITLAIGCPRGRLINCLRSRAHNILSC